MTQNIVTRDNLTQMLQNSNPRFVTAVVGRALVVLLNNQTADERASNITSHDNGRGFTGCDAHSGTLSAKYFLKHGTLLDWQLRMWTKQNKHGVPRIARYWAQLDAAARAKVLPALAAQPVISIAA